MLRALFDQSQIFDATGKNSRIHPEGHQGDFAYRECFAPCLKMNFINWNHSRIYFYSFWKNIWHFIFGGPETARVKLHFFFLFPIIQIESSYENKMADSPQILLQEDFAVYIYGWYTSSFYIFKSIFELQKKKHQFSSFAAPRSPSYQRVLRTMIKIELEPPGRNPTRRGCEALSEIENGAKHSLIR